MKNIHVLPTEKPSRLYLTTHEYIFEEGYSLPTDECENKNIYITSDEEIKEGDYRYSAVQNNIELVTEFSLKVNNEYWKLNPNLYKKIILTTDQDLIKNDVQAINDEFLEWFVKNPSCEGVEISYGVLKPFQSADKGYMIHLPDNEVLQQPKQGTPEEAAEIILANNIDGLRDALKDDDLFYFYKGVIQCYGEAMANWQQEQDKKMYSEEEVLDLIYKRDLYLLNRYEEIELELPEDWFEQFKNK
jgi:hypothetical protein